MRTRSSRAEISGQGLPSPVGTHGVGDHHFEVPVVLLRERAGDGRFDGVDFVAHRNHDGNRRNALGHWAPKPLRMVHTDRPKI